LRRLALIERLAGHDPIDLYNTTSANSRASSPSAFILTRQFVLECQLNITRIKRGRLNEAQTVRRRELLRLLRRYCPQMSQIALIAHQHDHNVRIRMIPQLLQPPRHVLVRLMLADIVDKQRTNRTAVVRGRDGAIALLARRIPDLCFDGLVVDLDAAGRELDADSGLAVEVEFVAGEAREQVGLADAGVAY
jgi:hypothetical protein